MDLGFESKTRDRIRVDKTIRGVGDPIGSLGVEGVALIQRGVRAAHHLAHYAAAPLRRWQAAAGRPRSERDRRLYELKDRHQGRRAFVIGAGPSLQIPDLERLGNDITFASNKIYLAMAEITWRPTYYNVIDVLVAQNNAERIRALDLTHIHSAAVRPHLGDDPRFLYLDHLPTIERFGGRLLGFSRDLLNGVYGGRTVIYQQLQIAFYMGIREVYLIGVDFSFDVPKGSTTDAKSDLGETVIRSRGEVNHFHPDYRKPGEAWTMPRLAEQRQAFRRAREVFEQAGGCLINASRRTKLDVLERADFDQIAPAAQVV